MTRFIGFVVALFIGFLPLASAQSKGTVLVVLSSESQITLKDGKVHATGFFLQELVTPVRKIKDAGYDVVYANPKGTKPVVDAVSNSYWIDKATGQKFPWFQNEKQFNGILNFCLSEGLCSKNSLVGTLTPKTLSEVRKNLDEFSGVFIPGGHAPMEDLWKDSDLGEILQHFHAEGKPTGSICHGPIALLSAMEDPEGYIEALQEDDRETMAKLAKNWIYKNYQITSFTTREEMQEEPTGTDNALGGYVQFYPDEALEKADAFLSRGDKWTSHISVHKELITGQNPFSDHELADAFVKALENYRLTK